MFKRVTKIANIFGIKIQLHFSWWFIFFLLTWALATGFFPQFFPGLTTLNYWLMSGVAAILLFISVLLHELSHALVARAKKIKVESITLFFFGGVAGITKEDIKPSVELQMALAGPIFSLFLSLVFFLIFKLNGHAFWTPITFYLYQLNFILALFNLVPGFPLDGGRALRAILYWYYKDLKKATRIASRGGKFFAAVLVGLGLLAMITGAGNGLWFILIGIFLYFIAGVSYQQVVIKQALTDVPLKTLIKKKFTSLNPNMRFSDFVKKYKNKEEEYFVVKGQGYLGLFNLKQLGPIPKTVRLKQLATPITKIKTLKKEDSAYQAFKKLAQQKLEVLPVMDKNKLIGLVTRDSLRRRLIWEMNYSPEKRKTKEVNKK